MTPGFKPFTCNLRLQVLRKKLHSIAIELSMLKDNLRRIGGVETLLYNSQAEEQFHQFI